MSNKTDDRSDTLLLLIPMWMMMMVVIIIPLGNDDPNSLLTDEQKLEKQKEIEEQKRLKAEQDAKNKKWWDDKITYVLEEKPFPYVHLIGLLIFIAAFAGYTRGRYRFDGFFSTISNPFFMIPLMFGFLYLAWLSGDFSLTKLGFVTK